MTASPPELPAFGAPPLIEVALSIQFEPLIRLDDPQIAMLWINRFFDRFPHAEQQPPLERRVERFGPPIGEDGGVLELTGKLESRWWLRDPSGARLIQVQRDRLVYNWRKVDDADAYPRYARIRREYAAIVDTFSEFVGGQGIGKIVPDQAELSYYNHVPRSGVWERHNQLERVLRISRLGEVEDDFLPEPENARVGIRYLIPGEGEKPAGRLHVSAEPAFRISDNEPIFVLNLVARGMYEGSGMQGALRFMDTGHEWVVRAFAALTTPEMHAVWRRHGSQ